MKKRANALTKIDVSKIVKAYSPNLTLLEISEKADVDYPRVSQVLRRRGLTPSQKGIHCTRVVLTDEQKKMIAKIAHQSLSVKEVAEKVNAKIGTVYAHLNRYKFPYRRERAEKGEQTIISEGSFSWNWAKSVDSICAA